MRSSSGGQGRFATKRTRGERQRTLDDARTPSGRGGWRPNAGRKPSPDRKGPVHRRRVDLDPHHPLHVTLRTEAAVGRLRRRHAYQAVRAALVTTFARADFRVVHVSIQHNHVHLLVEATDRHALARGMQGLCISVSRRLNRRLRRKGRVFAHRYDARAITCPRQARGALAYVLNNGRRHREDWRSATARCAPVDPYSSAPQFDGWRELSPAEARAWLPRDYEPLPTARATTWLLTVGWKRHGTIAIRERPGPFDA